MRFISVIQLYFIIYMQDPKNGVTSFILQKFKHVISIVEQKSDGTMSKLFQKLESFNASFFSQQDSNC